MILFFAGVLMSTPALESAGPVVHIYCAELFFAYCRPHYTKAQKEAFIRGTLFPDIRYVAQLPRTSTHKRKVTLDTVCAAPDPFHAGKLFHSYVDDQRAQLAWREKMHRHVQFHNKRNSHLLKLIEDELAYKKICASCARRALTTFQWSELQNGVGLHHVLVYQSNLLDYLSQSPLELFHTRSNTKRGYLLLDLGTVQEWHVLIENYAKDAKVIQYVHTLLSACEKFIHSYVQKGLKTALKNSASEQPSILPSRKVIAKEEEFVKKIIKKMLDTYPTL